MAFTAKALTFLSQLERNNDKAWFEAHKAEFQASVQEPALEFIEEAGAWFEAEGLPYRAVAKKVGGSLSRIHRDTRFSKDKSPYNPRMHMHFRHKDDREGHCMPAVGVLFSHKELGVGGGVWMAETPVLNQVRDAIVADPKGWTKATKGLELHGESLKTAPKGYDKVHPLIVDLRRTAYAVHVPLSKAEFTGDLGAAFRKDVVRMQPFLGFVEEALA